MPCKQCKDGKYKWGETGECQYDTLQECEEANKDYYEKTTKKNTYDTPYIPTPYYFLKIICLFLKKIKDDNFLILDLGCGYSRVQYFFSSYFNSIFFGVDINGRIIDELKKKKN